MKTVKLAVTALVVLGLAGLARAESTQEYYQRGGQAFKTGQYDQAIGHYNKALELNPRYAEAYVNRGIAQAHKGKADQAIVDFDKALELNPNYAKAYYNRALAFCVKKDFDRAWEDVHKAQTLGYTANPEFLEKLRRASGRSE
jgi:tetratricopeptide (TPR) repeat protein